jgi:hypothetical protein
MPDGADSANQYATGGAECCAASASPRAWRGAELSHCSAGPWVALTAAIVVAIPAAGAIIMLRMRLTAARKAQQDATPAEKAEIARAYLGNNQPSEAQTQPARNGWRQLFSSWHSPPAG